MERFRRFTAVAAALATLFSGPAFASFVEGPFTWTQGEQTKLIASGNDFVCVLTRVSGKFQGGGERVSVILQDGGVVNAAGEATTWSIGGSSLQQGVSATAHCFRMDGFVAAGTDRWNSPTFSVSGSSGSKCVTKISNTWWGDAATFINGISGNFAGGGEAALVTQASSGFTPSSLVAKTCQPFLQVWGNAFFAGMAHSGQVAQFWGPNGQGSAAVAGEYSVFATPLSPNKMAAVTMAPVEEAMCYFTKIGGKFRGGGEFVEIAPAPGPQGVAVWVLKARSGQKDGISAAARCFRRKQS